MNKIVSIKHPIQAGDDAAYGPSVLERVRDLLPEVEARADEIEAGTRVPLDLLAKLEDAGAFRMCLPRSYGGAELPLHKAVQVIEETAAVDASTAWHMMVAAGSQVILARLPIETLDDYYSNGADVWPKAAAAPKGIAIPVEGGYRLSGRWPLASGARDFEWVSLGFFIRDEDGIRKGPDGKMPDFRVCLVRREGVKVIETWDAVGLRGTRSDDLECKDLFVPEAAQASLFGPSSIKAPMLGIRMPYATGPHHSAVAIGLLQGAFDDLAASALTRKPAFAPTTVMKDDPVFRSRFGELAARFDALRALYEKDIAILETCDREERDVTVMEAARLSAATSLIEHDATALMDQIMALSGSAGVYMSNRQQRRWRDLRCAAQHQAANIGNYGNYAVALIEEQGARIAGASHQAPPSP